MNADLEAIRAWLNAYDAIGALPPDAEGERRDAALNVIRAIDMTPNALAPRLRALLDALATARATLRDSYADVNTAFSAVMVQSTLRSNQETFLPALEAAWLKLNKVAVGDDDGGQAEAILHDLATAEQRIEALEASNTRLTMDKAALKDDLAQAANDCHVYRQIERLAIKERGKAKRRITTLERDLGGILEALRADDADVAEAIARAALQGADDATP